MWSLFEVLAWIDVIFEELIFLLKKKEKSR